MCLNFIHFLAQPAIRARASSSLALERTPIIVRDGFIRDVRTGRADHDDDDDDDDDDGDGDSSRATTSRHDVFREIFFDASAGSTRPRARDGG